MKLVQLKTNIYYFPSLYCGISLWHIFRVTVGYLIYRVFVQLSKSRRSAYKNTYTQNAIPKRNESRTSPEILLHACKQPQWRAMPSDSTQVVETLVTWSVQWVKVTAEFSLFFSFINATKKANYSLNIKAVL